ncbi:MAG: hypothetical protein DRQ49_10095 [Gammaproteobacteria bacterium]|nr:MAG: hypothetical protein DRQ49_10095 [Gammaproteobacteria bacterium]RKZ43996.1 MAG: hypothetical protein DRQ41_03910 [Gammaproteobacteria bacterium]RKZ73281.1 MAG: hypothetical protein DRQ57_14835 [Gammaproteobacteria bacterium]
MEMMKKTYENIAQKFFISSEQLLQDSLKIYLLHRKQEFLHERFESLSRYAVTNANELEEKIKQGILPEHPTWEELIDLKNLEQEIQGIQDDLNRLSKSGIYC